MTNAPTASPPEPAPAPSTSDQLRNAGTAALTYSGAPALAYYTVNTINDVTYFFFHAHISSNGMGLLWIVVTGVLAYVYAHSRGLEALIEQAGRIYHVQSLNHTYVIGGQPTPPTPTPPPTPPAPAPTPAPPGPSGPPAGDWVGMTPVQPTVVTYAASSTEKEVEGRTAGRLP